MTMMGGALHHFSPGAGVVTSRGLVRYVATKHCVAYLHGESIRERSEALIERIPSSGVDCMNIVNKRTGCSVRTQDLALMPLQEHCKTKGQSPTKEHGR
jgi:altronate dehydratase